MLRRFRIFEFWAFCAIFLLTSSGVAQAEAKRFADDTEGVSFTYSGVFEEVAFPPGTTPGLLTALKATDGGFPTVNLLVQPGTLSELASKAPALLAEELVLADYRKVGLNDVRLIRAGQLQRGLFVEVEYSSAGAKLGALVAIYSAPDRHYVLTFTDHAEALNSHQPLFREISGSFAYKGQQAGGSFKKPAPTRTSVFFEALLALVLVAILGFVLRAKSKTAPLS